jgi:hypothetical protein
MVLSTEFLPVTPPKPNPTAVLSSNSLIDDPQMDGVFHPPKA